MNSIQAKKPVILTGIRNWPEWQNYISSKIDPAIWKAIRPRHCTEILLAEPIKPVIKNFISDAEDESGLNDRQRNNLALARSLYKDNLKQYIKQQEQLREGSRPALTTALLNISTNLDILEWINTLANAIRVDDPLQVAALAREYQHILAEFNYSSQPAFLAWITIWEIFLLQGARLKMLDLTRGRWLFDIAERMTKPNIVFAENCRKAGKQLTSPNRTNPMNLIISQSENGGNSEESKVNLQQPATSQIDYANGTSEWSIGNVAADLRAWANLSLPAQEEQPKTKRGIGFQVGQSASHNTSRRKRRSSFHDENDRKRPLKECEACATPGHNIQGCWFIFPDQKPENYRLNQVHTKLVERRISENPVLASKVAAARKAAAEEFRQHEGSRY
ncbi:hypothetical protein QQS21_006648 [Conoideocrella luteorostrata]|uniref:Gag protein n=1 Tax=Conoideocrella luteorostrata TaxID=1105319 RepID=A0AAJ0FSQ5_9HYPO|nr:hypothetical protein QQS21_006648 [Conoideocrella luteorostrata]